MLLALTLASMLVLTALAWFLRRAALPRLCPLCAGVAGTWIGLLVAHAAGAAVDLRLPAILLGGSVVGLAGLGERALAARPPLAVLAWKTAFVATGFATAYALLIPLWASFAFGMALLAALLTVPWLLARRATSEPPSDTQASLLVQLKNCC
ncbi:MAG: hypothetical protein HY423_00165 [Candidatus Lambdaproteobacteria bacterium]|nr:hypothetical protein [Candidatus Lambdaproteobacteria bacterium]